MNSDKQRNSQIEVSVDYMDDRLFHLIHNNQPEDARAILMEWEELMAHEDGDDSVTVIWMKNLAGSY